MRHLLIALPLLLAGCDTLIQEIIDETFPDTPPDTEEPVVDGGDAPGGSGTDDNSPEDTDFDVYFDEATSLYFDIGGAFDPIRTAPTALPATGTADYAGVLGVGLPTETGSQLALGDLTMSVDFEASTATGAATDFIDEANETYTGTLTLSGGTLNTSFRAPETLSADLSGTLSAQSGAEYAIDGTLTGDFYEGPDFIAGDISADVTTGGETISADSEFIAGP